MLQIVPGKAVRDALFYSYYHVIPLLVGLIALVFAVWCSVATDVTTIARIGLWLVVGLTAVFFFFFDSGINAVYEYIVNDTILEPVQDVLESVAETVSEAIEGLQ